MKSTDSKDPLVILHLEDNPMDREVVAKTLKAEGIECQILSCEQKNQFQTALEQAGFQIILSDYQLPGFDGHQALEMAQKICPEIPFLFLSGVLGEEAAIESLKSGATDYVLKQRLERLGPAVKRALAETRERAQRQLAEDARQSVERRFRIFMDNLPALAFIKDHTNKWVWLNRRWSDLLPGNPDDLIGKDEYSFYPEATAQKAREIEAQVFQSGISAESMESFGETKDGLRSWLVTRFLIEQPEEKPRLGGIAFDITGRVKAEQDLAAEKSRLQKLVDHNLARLASFDAQAT